MSAAEQTVETAEPADPPKAAVVLRLAAIDAAKGQPEAALARLEAYAQVLPLPRSAALLRVQMLARLNRLEHALSEAKKLREQYPDRPNVVRMHALLLYRSRSRRRFREVFKEGIATWPSDPHFLMSMNQLSLSDAYFRGLYAILSDHYRQKPFEARSAYEYAIAALRLGEIETAAEVLDSIVERSTIAGRMRQGLTAMSPDEWRRRFRIRNDPTLPIQHPVKRGADITVIVFPGARNRFDQMHLSYLDALLFEHPVNVIYLADPSLRSCMLGVPTLGKGMESSARTLKQISEGFGATRIFTMGSSAGGFSALRYGYLMNAERVLTISGYTMLRGHEEPEEERAFAKHVVKELSMEQRSTRPQLEARPDMALLQIAAADNIHDVRQASRVSDLPNVRTISVPGVKDHAGVVHGMIGSGEFQRILAEWLA